MKLPNSFPLIVFLFYLTLYCSFFYKGHSAFQIQNRYSNQQCKLFMGRASAVRAATKAKTDGRKEKLYALYGKKVINAVKSGGADPSNNRLLSQVIIDAKNANVPKEIITRNIEKSLSANSDGFKESIFEFYGHGGVGIIVHSFNDNINRASAAIALAAKKNMLKPAAMNSVLFKFSKKLQIKINSKLSEDSIMEFCLDSNINDYIYRSDIENEPNLTIVLVDLKDSSLLIEKLQENSYTVDCSIVHIPVEGYITISKADYEKNLLAIEEIEKVEDVDLIEHNIDTNLRDL